MICDLFMMLGFTVCILFYVFIGIIISMFEIKFNDENLINFKTIYNLIYDYKFKDSKNINIDSSYLLHQRIKEDNFKDIIICIILIFWPIFIIVDIIRYFIYKKILKK